MSYLRTIARYFAPPTDPPDCLSARQPMIESLEHRIVLNAATPAASWSDVYNDKTLPASALSQTATPTASDTVVPIHPVFTLDAMAQGIQPVKSPGSPAQPPPVFLPEPAELTLLGMGAMLVLRRRRRSVSNGLVLDTALKR